MTTGTIRPELRVIAVVSRDGGGTLDPEAGDLAVTAGWGHAGGDGQTMPGRGHAVERPYTPDERKALGAAVQALGEPTFDVYLNGTAFWRCVPANVWNYTLGGYQVLKKWLSYREKELLGRDLMLDEGR